MSGIESVQPDGISGEIVTLREAVLDLTEHVRSVSERYSVLVELQRRQQDIDGRAAEAVRKAAEALSISKDVSKSTIPREEVERAFAGLADEAIRRQRRNNRLTGIGVTTLFVLSCVAVTVGYFLNRSFIQDVNHSDASQVATITQSRIEICKQANANSRQATREAKQYFRPFLTQEEARRHPDPVIVSILAGITKQRPQLVDCGAIAKKVAPSG